MTPIEIRDALKLLDKRIGAASICGIRVTIYGKKPIAASINNSKLGVNIDVEADDWAEAFAKLHEAWDEARKDGQSKLIKSMAIAIIRLTDERGECTDQMLRAEFDAGDVTAFMDRAIERADEMAANGPFIVRRVAESNAA